MGVLALCPMQQLCMYMLATHKAIETGRVYTWSCTCADVQQIYLLSLSAEIRLVTLYSTHACTHTHTHTHARAHTHTHTIHQQGKAFYYTYMAGMSHLTVSPRRGIKNVAI